MLANTLQGFYRGFSTVFVAQPIYIGAAFGGLELGKVIASMC